jgi:hypothetical protein
MSIAEIALGRTYHLTGSHTSSFDRKLSSAHIKEILQARAKQVDHENIVQPFLAKMIDLWDASYIWQMSRKCTAGDRGRGQRRGRTAASKNSVRPTLVAELGRFGFAGFLEGGNSRE